MSKPTTRPTACWCGNADLTPFSSDYVHCGRCETLVSLTGANEQLTQVGADEAGLYGREYWFSHQAKIDGLPDITARARLDLPERCTHWLRTLLRYKLPPAKTLELGAAHGGFVAMMRWAGFDSTGLELSPSIVGFARETFQVPMLHGPLESQPTEAGSLDVVVMMDVIEHLPDPIGTMRRAASLLKPDGILLVQTPEYPEGRAFDDLRVAGHTFVNHLQPVEHLNLFSRRATTELFARVGLGHVRFEPAIFAQYDQFFVASRAPLPAEPPSNEAVRAALGATPGGRLVEALLTATERRDYFQRECAARLEVINSLAAEVDRLRAEAARYQTAQLESIAPPSV